MSGPEVSPDLMKLAEGFNAKVQAGSAIQASSGFGGKGLEKLDAQSNMVKKIQKKSTGGELGEEGEGEQDEATAAATAAAEAKFEGDSTRLEPEALGRTEQRVSRMELRSTIIRRRPGGRLRTRSRLYGNFGGCDYYRGSFNSLGSWLVLENASFTC